ncbi:MAG: 4-phosphoerythronate dehydrogenase PdxB [Bacteroidales bacterium]|nr:4-phosphoerythronate dehydrogenase PdxB [Bacteroidales bacterium]
MKIIIDDKIPYIRGAFESLAEVVYLPGSKTTPDVVKDADAIVTRTRTICNGKLLANSSVKFIVTATIGFDHIDTTYCDTAGIQWTNAPGCNSKSVEQYIASTIMVLIEEKSLQLEDLTIGVVGVGNVGSKVAKICEAFGMRVMLNDPPRERAEGSDAFVSLKRIQEEADIISLHVPLNMSGDDATFHLADGGFFADLKRNPILINSCRGEVVETNAVKQGLLNKQIGGFVCDCWENEPEIDLELLELTTIATPHIAGYSKDGKATGTRMSVEAISRFFGLGLDDWKPSGVEAPLKPIIELDGKNLSRQEILKTAILATYDIRNDDKALRASVETFEQQRGDYPTRREFPAFTILAKHIDIELVEVLKNIGFNVEITF